MNQDQTMTVTVLENTEDYVRVIARFGIRLWSVYGGSFPRAHGASFFLTSKLIGAD